MRLERLPGLFGFESAIFRRFPRQGKSQAARNGAGSQPTCATLAGQQENGWTCAVERKPGYVLIFSMAWEIRFAEYLEVVEMGAEIKVVGL